MSIRTSWRAGRRTWSSYWDWVGERQRSRNQLAGVPLVVQLSLVPVLGVPGALFWVTVAALLGRPVLGAAVGGLVLGVAVGDVLALRAKRAAQWAEEDKWRP